MRSGRIGLAAAALVASGLVACNGASDLAGVPGKYTLVQYGGQSLPVAYQFLALPAGGTCADTLYGQTLDLRSDHSLALTSDVGGFCGAAPAGRNTAVVNGSYLARGDSVYLHLNLGAGSGQPSTATVVALSAGDSLALTTPVVTTEEQPPAGSTSLLVYRRSP